VHPWLSRLRHDLVKPAVWPARDLRDAAREPAAGDLLRLRDALLDLRDGEGQALTASALWQRMRAEAPALPAAALDAFGEAVAGAERAVSDLPAHQQRWRAALDAVLRLVPAFANLARSLEQE
jgi:hypothetical protein